MKIRVYSLLMLLILMLSFIGCNENKDSSNSPNIMDNSSQSNDSTLDDYIIKTEAVYGNLSFLTNDQQKIFSVNLDLLNWQLYSTPTLDKIYTQMNLGDNETVKKDNCMYVVLDLLWNVFEEDMLNIFSENYIKVMSEQSFPSVINHEGNVALIIADGGFSLPNHNSYTVLETTNNSIRFIIKGYFYIYNGESEEEFAKRTENMVLYDYTVENEIRLIYDADSWKIDYLKRS